MGRGLPASSAVRIFRRSLGAISPTALPDHRALRVDEHEVRIRGKPVRLRRGDTGAVDHHRERPLLALQPRRTAGSSAHRRSCRWRPRRRRCPRTLRPSRARRCAALPPDSAGTSGRGTITTWGLPVGPIVTVEPSNDTPSRVGIVSPIALSTLASESYGGSGVPSTVTAPVSCRGRLGAAAVVAARRDHGDDDGDDEHQCHATPDPPRAVARAMREPAFRSAGGRRLRFPPPPERPWLPPCGRFPLRCWLTLAFWLIDSPAPRDAWRRRPRYRRPVHPHARPAIAARSRTARATCR